MALTRLQKIAGIKGLYLSLCKKFKVNPIAITIPVFGKIRTLHEILNIHDNFAVGELRNKRFEKLLSAEVAPVILDCGVNVGTTVRWWFHLNPKAKVYGVDMIPESHSFTIDSMEDPSRYTPIENALDDESGRLVTLDIEDPLQGENRMEMVSSGGGGGRG